MAIKEVKTEVSPDGSSPSLNGSVTEEILEERQLEQRFSLLGMIGLYFSMGAAPLAIGNSLTVVPGLGVGAFMFWGTLVGVFFQLFICVSLAEISSAFPHALGPSFWAAALAPPEWKKFLSYWTAVATALQTQFDAAAFWVFTIYIISGTVTVFTGLEFSLTAWQSFLVIVGLVATSLVLNISSKALDGYAKLTTTMAALIIGTCVIQFVAILVRASPKQSAYAVFLNTDNETGWESLGLVFLFATVPGSSVVTGFNYVAHMSEEVPEPQKTIPVVMITSSILSAVTAVLAVFVLILCSTNPDSLYDPIAGMPLVQILWDGNRSLALTGLNMVLMCVIFVVGGMGFLTTTSRLIWTFCNHGGLAFSGKLGKVNEKTFIPQNAVFFTASFSVLICLLLLGPSTVLNALFGFSSLSVLISYGVPIWMLIIRGRHLLPNKRYLNLGRCGLFFNVVGGLWLILSSIIYCFPNNRPVTSDNMNYAAPVFLGLYSLFIPNYLFYSRKHYKVPHQLAISHHVEENTAVA